MRDIVHPARLLAPVLASDAEIATAVQRMYTDPAHLRGSDPGQVEDHVVFTYHDAFDSDVEGPADLTARYRRGGLGDVALKRRPTNILQTTIAPIREPLSAP